MTSIVSSEPRRLSTTTRILLAMVSVVLLALLVTARMLQPSSDGLGTHQQLGLPACTLLTLFGVRCPSCGMTTSWAYVTRGDLAMAARCNAGGALGGVMVIIAAPWMLASALRGRWITSPPSELMLVIGAVTLVVVTLIDWAYRLMSA